MLSPSQAAIYRRMTLGDESLMTALSSAGGGVEWAIDQRTTALVRLAD